MSCNHVYFFSQQNNSIEIWTRPITPVSSDGKYSYAMVFFNRRTLGGPVTVTAQLQSLGLDNPNFYTFYDAFSSEEINFSQGNITVKVNPSGIKMVIAKRKTV